VYRFALRPRWIVSHLLVAALVVTMVNLGFWQLRRLDEKRRHNRLVERRTSQPVAAVADVLPAGTGTADVDPVELRRVRASGTFDAGAQLLVRGRSLDGRPGSWVVAPLRLADGRVLVVNRGWIPNDGSLDAVPRRFAAPTGRVTVTGLLQRTETRGRLGATDPSTGRVGSLARLDVAHYARQLRAEAVPAWVQLTDQVPAVDAAVAPRPLGPPTLDEGPHFGYAMQWFIFSAIAVIGYPLVLRRVARERAADDDDVDLDGPDPHDVPEPDDPRLGARQP